MRACVCSKVSPSAPTPLSLLGSAALPGIAEEVRSLVMMPADADADDGESALSTLMDVCTLTKLEV